MAESGTRATESGGSSPRKRPRKEAPPPLVEGVGEHKKARGQRAAIEDPKKTSKIWLNHKLVARPNYITSYGILMYRESTASDDPGSRRNSESADEPAKDNGCRNSHGDVPHHRKEFEYLLGLIPQGNAWTVFKGLPEPNETPEETAVREFEEETSLRFPYPFPNTGKNVFTTKLYGVTSTKKLLQIYLVPSPPELDTSRFDVDKVVTIDGSGRFSGLPEIIEIRFLTKDKAIEGVRGKGNHRIAKIYKSQISILERADSILHQE
uniref:Nudix hydrolase domain-containing protein n=1 Tax=Pseudo-nitzschia multistriata TaxID=183589 RepID=A0A448ZKH9_9STRA